MTRCTSFHEQPTFVYVAKSNTLPETNTSHPKTDDWKSGFLLGWLEVAGAILVYQRVTRNSFEYTASVPQKCCTQWLKEFEQIAHGDWLLCHLLLSWFWCFPRDFWVPGKRMTVKFHMFPGASTMFFQVLVMHNASWFMIYILGGGFWYVLFSPLPKWSNLTCAYFSNGLVQPPPSRYLLLFIIITNTIMATIINIIVLVVIIMIIGTDCWDWQLPIQILKKS